MRMCRQPFFAITTLQKVKRVLYFFYERYTEGEPDEPMFDRNINSVSYI